LLSFFLQGFWMYLLAGLGGIGNKSATESNTIVAAFMLYSFSYNVSVDGLVTCPQKRRVVDVLTLLLLLLQMGGASIPYLLGSEIPNSAVREKTQGLGAAWNVVWAFVTNFVIPYMINDIRFAVGWVFGSIAISAFFFTFLFLPETKVRQTYSLAC
jgi:MFS transporter, SP family, sugar:H+ symporter